MFCVQSALDMLATELKTYTKVCEFDDLGMLRKTEVHCAGTPILSDVITYKKNGEKTTMCVANEKFTHNGSTRTRAYTTDLYGRVTSVADTVLGNHTYEYDYRGFLVREDNKIFEYDGNGNITRAGDKVFTYDSVIKDRLMSVGGKPITYSESNPLNPQTYDGKTFEFEGRRLVKVTSDNMVATYKYDDTGLRIEKTVTENGVTTTTKFVYDGGKLIAEYTGTRRVAYLYDENGMLYGFIYNNAKYFYIRDALQNILGIVDANGTAVVHYDYSAYGECKAIIGSKANTVGSINSFRYKGYYFDNETAFFYCKSRYYVPFWLRWLCPDKYAFPGNIANGNNIHVYCNNNPTSYTDTTGEFPIAIAVFVIVIYGAVASTILSDWKEEDEVMHAAFHPTSDSNLFYISADADTIYDQATSVTFEAGLYDETAQVNEYNYINIDVVKAAATIGFTGLGAGIYLGEVTFTNEVIRIGERKVAITGGINFGWGAEVEIGSKTSVSLACGKGITLSFEII